MVRLCTLVAAVSSMLAVAACADGPGSDPPVMPSRTPSVSAHRSETEPPEDPGGARTLTVHDDGAVVRLRVGDTAELVVRDPLAPDPVVEGTAIDLVEVVNITQSGIREWEVRAVSVGEAMVAAVDPPKRFTIRFRVSGRE
jgi:hypothetical protein